MADHSATDFDWQVRHFIYQHFKATGSAPTIEQTAQQFGVSVEAARDSYHHLNDAHAIFLTPSSDTIYMASPFSNVPTDYRVYANGVAYWANCAWDSLGIPAALHSDAEIEAVLPLERQTVCYAIRNGVLEPPAEGVRIHFSLPCRIWYENLIHT